MLFLSFSYWLKPMQTGGFRFIQSINHILLCLIEQVKISEPGKWGRSALITNKYSEKEMHSA